MISLHSLLTKTFTPLAFNILKSRYKSKCKEFSGTERVHCYHRFYASVALKVVEVHEYNDKISRGGIPSAVKNKVKSVLFDYLHSTRGLLYSHAEFLSENAPLFLKNLAENVRYETDVRRSMARFLRYHPINEFEPFFESIGLDPLEYAPLLPRNLMFLCDEDGLLDNYHVLCEYGIKRDKIGKIYKEAREVFRYGDGILLSKLQAFEETGISNDVIARFVTLIPNLLVSCTSREFFELVKKFKCLGFEISWVEQRLVESTTFDWRKITRLLHLLHDLGCNDEEIKVLVGRYPGVLFDYSGKPTLSLIGFLLKFGCSKTDICLLLMSFPQVKVEKFVWNLRRVFELLFKIEMDAVIIGRIIRGHFGWMGTYSVKSADTIRTDYLNTGKQHMCQIIMANPMELRNWTLRAKIECLTDTKEVRSRRDKLKFLTSIGFTEKSKEIEKALKALRGKGDELPERFNCLVKAGLGENDVAKMIKAAPHILNQSVEVLEAKIRVLVNDLGYPVSSVTLSPGVMAYTIDRMMLRCTMYQWLIDQNVGCSTLALTTIIGCTESRFLDKYVSRHPRGGEVWQNYKQMFSSP